MKETQTREETVATDLITLKAKTLSDSKIDSVTPVTQANESGRR